MPPYLPFPRFLMEADLVLATKLVYAVLLDRAQLSQANGWADASGQIYILMDKKLATRRTENCPPDGQKTIPLMDRKLSTNNLTSNLSELPDVREGACTHAQGRYGNVFLTEAEVAELQADFPTVWQEYIERLSEYMASTGKTYKSHAATIRRWAKEDRRKGKGGISDYSCKEGESL